MRKINLKKLIFVLIMPLFGAVFCACQNISLPYTAICEEAEGGRIAISLNNSISNTETAHKVIANEYRTVYVFVYIDSGYELVADSLKFNDSAINGNFFNMPASDVTVSAEFRKIDYKINIDENLTITRNDEVLDNDSKINIGDVLNISYELEIGYEVRYLRANGNDIGNTFVVGTSGVTFTFAIKQSEYRLITPAGIVVKIQRASPSNNGASYRSIYYGDTLQVSYDHAGYTLEEIFINGEKYDGGVFTVQLEDVEITVTESKIPFDLTFADGITVTRDGVVLTEADNIFINDVLTITCQFEAGYRLGEIYINSQVFSYSNNAEFTVKAESVAISYTTEKIPYYINCYYLGVTITKDGVALKNSDAVYIGDELTITYERTYGYTVQYFRVNGEDFAGGTYIVGAGNVNIVLSQTRNVYAITYSAGFGINVKRGEENIYSSTYLYAGDVLTITYRLNDGYAVDYFRINGEDIIDNTYIVKEDDPSEMIIEFAQKIIPYSLIIPNKVTVKRGGIELTEADSVYIGEELTVIFQLDTGYQKSYFRINGKDFSGGYYRVATENIVIEFAQEPIVYKLSIGENIKVIRGEEELIGGSDIFYGDVLTIVNTLPDWINEDYEFVLNGKEFRGTTYTVATENITLSLQLRMVVESIEFLGDVFATKNGEPVLPTSKIYRGDIIEVFYNILDGFEFESLYTLGLTHIADNQYYVDSNKIVIHLRQAFIAYSITIPDGVTVKRNGIELTNSDKVQKYDRLIISYTLTIGYKLEYLKINGEFFADTDFVVGASDVIIEFAQVPIT